ncbi:MAG: phosphoribosylamine--glycine ligase [Candidatus Pacebacteria bacterium]|nr:phosphoribosylamine--glycine ligase [Candidatus Paceibacterota bacterium]
MNILVIGGGAREHALVWKLKQSPLVETLYCLPGNAGIAQICKTESIAVDNLPAIIVFAKSHQIDLVMVGPELPLTLGLVDALQEQGIAAFGPSKAAARLEGSKGFMKDFCARHRIPTASYRRFTAEQVTAAHDYCDSLGGIAVIKADGLAAGKGVTVPTSALQAHQAIDDALLHGAFGAAGREIVIEEMMVGREYSFFALCDGQTALPFGAASDYKRLREGNLGPNTGGMGAISVELSEAEVGQIMTQIINPTVAGMVAEAMPFVGILFAGLMKTATGFKLIEYNVRFGDPETLVVMMQLQSDLLPLLLAAVQGQLAGQQVEWRQESVVTVVLAAGGYPMGPLTTGVLGNFAAVPVSDDLMVFHAGTKLKDGQIMASGGRVLAVTARGDDLAAARLRVYEAYGKITYPADFLLRRDIGG